MMSEDALTEKDFRRILAEACRSESDDVGMGWGKGRSRISGLQYAWTLPAITRAHWIAGSLCLILVGKALPERML